MGLRKEYLRQREGSILVWNEDGQFFGELIGPKLQGNLYGLERHVWIPFSYAMEKLKFKFWDKLIPEFQGKTDNETYEKVSNVFRGLWSLFKRQRNRELFGDGHVDESTLFEGAAAEGIVFYRRNTFPVQMSKLRRDMFDWYKGKQHGI